MYAEEVAVLIRQTLPQAEVTVEGDGCHLHARVVSAEFEGKPMLARHRMVYRALEAQLKQDIHALQLTTLTPEQAVSQ